MESKPVEDAIQVYLRGLKHELRRQGLVDREIMLEIESHLLDGVELGLAQGLPMAEAQRLALDRFGTVSVVATCFNDERSNWMRKILLVVALAVGILIAYVDSLPHWDDTGITVLALLVSSGLLGMLSPRRPWLWALAVGVWIPLVGLVVRHDPTMLIVLGFPFIGAYAGMAVRLLLGKILRPV